MGAIGVAWMGFPPAYPWPLERPATAAVLRAMVAAALGVTVLWCTGRPIDDGRAAGVLWRTPTGRNNIRSWISPTAVAGASVRPVPYPLGSTDPQLDPGEGG